MIKRLAFAFPAADRLRVISDNPACAEWVAAAEEIVINGKVIWYGRDLER